MFDYVLIRCIKPYYSLFKNVLNSPFKHNSPIEKDVPDLKDKRLTKL
jgi:hypothetical protein